jgi:hypothetical protein
MMDRENNARRQESDGLSLLANCNAPSSEEVTAAVAGKLNSRRKKSEPITGN